MYFSFIPTYVNPEHWNQPLDDVTANTMTDDWVMRTTRPAFLTAVARFTHRGTVRPLCIASKIKTVTVRRRWIWPIRMSKPRSITLLTNAAMDAHSCAGHSQGAFHTDRLLKEVIAGTELQQRMVAAYPVGFSIDGSNGIDICASANQTGCQVSWNTNSADAMVVLAEPGDICVNLITWQTNDAMAPASSNAAASVSAQVSH
ncbi:MAG: hypothetical protein CM15mP68_0090 [Pseudomonadota bacterium]|nr:MAG: hypothetical protein CM15mP68_0090 [Pseudomonadota bacterium]